MFKRFQLKNQKEAEKYYKKMQGSLNSLAQHPEFEVLKEYWEIAYSEVDAQLANLKGEELERAVLKRSVIEQHMNWMNNLLES